MNLKEYLSSYRAKGGFTANEAQVLCIPFPLQKGWKEKYANTSINSKQLELLILCMDRKSFSKARKEAKEIVKQLALKAIKSPKKQIMGDVFEPRMPTRHITTEFIKSNEFLVSYEWRRVRIMALKKHGSRCQCCGASPSTGAVMNVDHIKPRKTHPSLALDINNLQILCDQCNHGKGNWDQTDWR
jgi:hypothetical protein